MKFKVVGAEKKVGTWVVHHGPLHIDKFKAAMDSVFDEFKKEHEDKELSFDDWMLRFEKWLRKEGLLQ